MATDLLAAMQQYRDDIAAATERRDDAIAAAAEEGVKQRDIVEQTGYTRETIRQIVARRRASQSDGLTSPSG